MGTLYLCVGFVLIFGSLNVLSLIGESLLSITELFLESFRVCA